MSEASTRPISREARLELELRFRPAVLVVDDSYGFTDPACAGGIRAGGSARTYLKTVPAPSAALV